MKTVLAALLAGTVILGCSDDSMSPLSSRDGLNGTGAAAPNTPVSTTVTVSLPSTTVIRESGPPNNNNAAFECRAGGALWQKSAPPSGAPKQIGTAPHDQCKTVVDGLELEVDFAETATWVQAKSGNENLNFSLDPTDGVTPRGIQFKKTGSTTQGFGTLYSVDPTGWTIDLGKVYAAGDNLLQYRSILVEACNTADTSQCGSGWLTW